jgi:23S rRNA pseudouridine955/2504/2580 synthase
VVAKRRPGLMAVHAALREGRLEKRYLALVRGRWSGGSRRIEDPLRRNHLSSGERVVRVHPEGKASATVLRPLSVGPVASLLEARPLTGRTHQIRVHAAAAGHPIAGDPKYGDRGFDRRLRELGLRRLFLHASGLRLPAAGPDGASRWIRAPLPEPLRRVLEALGLDFDDAAGPVAPRADLEPTC